eukprot:TRINITY_DN2272_c0_g1_i1.p1 TRINITY_DN2272_c0_g1~~TRINITY_DN2272_c0_g1_i1.p1  ORF type:complete len:255 (+),score=48.12 TRINITY_DN2272_c0_g1_i1:78-767(+)
MSQPDLSAAGLFRSDPKLKDVNFAGWNKLASEDILAKTKKNLEAKSHLCTIVGTKQEALEAIKKAIPKGASVMNAGSTTLGEIGFTDYLKTQTDWKNLHTVILAEKDPAKQAELRRQSVTAEYFLSSVTAISEDGDITVCCLTGSRSGAFAYAAGKLILVVGANKIVPTYEDAVKRTYDYCLPVESARVRIVFKVPASSVNHFVAIRGPNPWGAPGRIHVIIVKEALGF